MGLFSYIWVFNLECSLGNMSGVATQDLRVALELVRARLPDVCDLILVVAVCGTGLPHYAGLSLAILQALLLALLSY